MLLTIDELTELTERKQPAAQRRWLDGHGIRYLVGASGHPRVLRAEVEKHMLSAAKPRSKELNLKAVA